MGTIYRNGKPYGGFQMGHASDVKFQSSENGVQSTNVQDAIEELYAMIQELKTNASTETTE